MSLRVLGLDLSYAGTGVGRINDEGASVRTIRPGARDGDERLDWIVCEIEEEFRWLPDLAVIEAPFIGKNPETGLQLGELHGCVKRSLYRHDIARVRVVTQHLKMYATGSGASTVEKAAVIHAVRSRYADQLGGPSAVQNDNEADGFVLAAMGRHAYGQPIAPVPVECARALRSVKWPTLRLGATSSRLGAATSPVAPGWDTIARPEGALL
jgi:Holliday junction resolvasome RuvABC endonuclease subunit